MMEILNRSGPLRVRVWGRNACFTRPEMKVERVSYPCMTPSAARGILEAIFWKPEIEWQVREIEVRGRNLAEGVPRSFTLNSNEILEALQEPLSGIVSAVKTALEQTPPELGADVAERGVVLTGGGALLRNLDKLLLEETGLPVVVADDPLTCVARGGGRALEMIDEYGRNVFAHE